MIPQKLQLKNFLSYHQASLDFTGLHTACICGPNGAGKTTTMRILTGFMAPSAGQTSIEGHDVVGQPIMAFF